MKRYLVFLFVLLLLFSSVSALADLNPATVVITIDGVRTAFFSEDGAYLSPMMADDGRVYVPVLSLAESLGLNVDADANTLAVTVNGVRTAFFDEDGNYMEPQNVDGTVYVPLIAFAGSAGVALTVDGDSYALTRSEAAQPDRPSDESVAVGLYGNVPVTLLNFEDYFIVTHSYYAPENYSDSDYRIVLTATAKATTNYDLVNVRFLLDRYGTMIIPSSGEASISMAYKPDEIFTARDSEDSINAMTAISGHYASIMAGVSTAESITSRPPNVQECSGFVRMSGAEAKAANEKLYQSAMSIVDGDSSSVDLRKAISAFDGLAEIGYSDSATQAESAREHYSAALQAEEDALMEAAYQDAMRQIDEGDNFGAIAALDVLAEAGYGDSAERTEALRASLYDQATDYLESGEYEAAAGLFDRLAELNYLDSAAQAENAQLEAIYNAAVALEDAKDYSAAITKYEECEGYKDSAERIAACQEAIPQIAYEAAEALLEKGKYLEARDAFLDIQDYKDSYERASECLEGQWQYALSLIPEDDGSAEQALGNLLDSQSWWDDSLSFTSLDKLREEYESGAIKPQTVDIQYGFESEVQPLLKNELLYQKAMFYIGQGDVRKAYDAFQGLNGYRNAHCLFSDDPELSPVYEQINLARFNDPGNIVLFGRYEQDGDFSNGEERIQWAVLDVQDGKALLISRFLLERMPFHNKNRANGWENSAIRKWLNGDFYQQAFTDAEKAAIVETELTYKNAYSGEKKAGQYKNTKDKVFFLLIPEAEDYLARDTTYVITEGAGGWTDYTVRYGGIGGVNYTDTFTLRSQAGKNHPWLTREQNADSKKNPDGDVVYCMNQQEKINGVSIDNHNYAVDEPCGIRPTMWVNIDAITIPERQDESSAEDLASSAPTYTQLSKGSKGNEVLALQQMLIDLGYLGGKADGDYGNMTLKAVKAFQKDAGLEQTGVADSDTQAVLFSR